MTPFTQQALEVISSIPEGRVLSYGLVATMAGNSSGARQVSRILSSMSEKYDLPWHRVVNARGEISLPKGRGYELQKAMLEAEGIIFSPTIDLVQFLWSPGEDFKFSLDLV